MIVLRIFSIQKPQSQKPQYSKSAVPKTAVLNNRSTQNPQYSIPQILKYDCCEEKEKKLLQKK